jgi:hypothetical protein
MRAGRSHRRLAAVLAVDDLISIPGLMPSQTICRCDQRSPLQSSISAKPKKVPGLAIETN